MTQHADHANHPPEVEYICRLQLIWVVALLSVFSLPALSDTNSIETLNLKEVDVVVGLVQNLPRSADALYLLGQVYNKQGDASEAVKSWKRCLALNPKHGDAYVSIGLVATQAGDFEKAVTFYRNALTMNPNLPGVHNYLALALIAQGRTQPAIAELKAELEISPNASKSHYELGRAYLLEKQYENAKASYEVAIALEPDYTQAYYGLASACARLGLRDESTRHMKAFKPLKAADLKKQVHRTRTFNDMASVRQSLATTYTQAGQIYKAHGDTHRAKTFWQKAGSLDVKNREARVQLLLLYQTEDETAKVLQVCYELTQIEPKNLEHYLNFGILSTRLDRFDLAESAFEKAISLAPRRAEGYRELAELYLRANHELADARKLAEKAVEIKPDAQSYYVLAWACDMNGVHDQALDALERAMKLKPADAKYRQMYDLIKKKAITR